MASRAPKLCGIDASNKQKKQFARGINNQPGSIMALLQSIWHWRKLLKTIKVLK